MTYEIEFHPLITRDYNEAYTYYENKQPGLGERFLKAVRAKVDVIREKPDIFASRSNKKFREAKVDFFPFLIIFRLNRKSGVIFVSSIHHTKKHPLKKYRLK